MRILAIETSCDDTGVAVLEAKNNRLRVLSNVVSSQQIHANYGGVFPMMAKREHQANLVPTLIQALTLAKAADHKPKTLNSKQIQTLKEIFAKENELFQFTKEFLETYDKPAVDMIAITNGPGLEPCLWVGVNFAKALSYIWGISVIPVNHIEAHILVNFLENKKTDFPAIALVVSGGHTQLILMKKFGSYKIIGETRDDAAGECFDKCAKMLGLGYPGGPIISKTASLVKSSSVHLPRPMMNSKDYDFSFSGLKTAVLYATRNTVITKEYVGQMCVEVQRAIIDVLIKKTLQAAKDFKVKRVILGGGVSANQELRKQLSEKSEIPMMFPEAKLSTDNALMIAVAAHFHKNKKASWKKLKADANLRIS